MYVIRVIVIPVISVNLENVEIRFNLVGIEMLELNRVLPDVYCAYSYIIKYYIVKL